MSISTLVGTLKINLSCMVYTYMTFFYGNKISVCLCYLSSFLHSLLYSQNGGQCDQICLVVNISAKNGIDFN